MPDYLEDLREVIRRGHGSDLKKQSMLRKVRKLELRVKKGGGDVNLHPQTMLVEALAGDKKEWMFRLCAARLLRGDYSDWSGWEFRNEWCQQTYLPNVNKRWAGESVKSLAIFGEQGIGDEILFGSCIPDVQFRGIEVTVECDSRLESVFQRSFGCKTRARDRRGENNLPLDLKRPEEAFIPLGDLPAMLRSSRTAFPKNPFIQASPEHLDKWSHLKGKTGIAWRGRRGQLNPKDLGLNNPVCLQYDAWEVETQGMIVPEINLHDDIEDLLGICANLERVITVPQTIVHLAASQGVPVEVIIPPVQSGRVPDQLNFKYGMSGKMDWYKSVRVFQNINEWRQTR